MNFRKDAKRIDLNGEWQMAFTFDRTALPKEGFKTIEEIKASGLPIYPAKVPGNFELDLHLNGIIPEPFFGMNIAELTEYERANAWYFREFEDTGLEGLDAKLVLEAIGGKGTTFVNGRLYLTFMPDGGSFGGVGFPKLKGRNEIIAALHRSSRGLTGVPTSPGIYHTLPCGFEGLRTRQAAHMYGWDIMPRAVSKGIWRDVCVLYLPQERLETVWLDTQWIGADRKAAGLCLCYESRLSPGHKDEYEIELIGTCGESSFRERRRMLFHAGRVAFTVHDPKLWWQRDRGDQNIYDCRVNLYKNGAQIDHVTFTHGIRTVELERTSVTDMTGKGEFCFRVNGEKIFVRGTNWVPLDAYHSRDIERVEQALELADEIGCNMIRCWGGNVYESDLFYEICDRKGILVWQDFAMACAVYPQDEHFCQTIRNEVRQVVRRLRQHACVALWAGDNECDLAYSWGGRRQNPNRNKLTRQVIPDVLFEEDPSRPYLPSSPYIDEEAFRVGERYITENHLWGPRDYYKSTFYTESLCHFASEIGYHGCPSPESIKKFISPEKVWPYKDNEEWILHCTSPIPGIDICDFRVELMAKQIAELFGSVPDNLEDFAFASQCSQAEAKKFFIELFRTSKWRRTGIIWWNLLDGWPQFSDAVVDYYFTKKLAFDFIKRAQVPLLVALREPSHWNQDLVACNDRRDDAPLSYRVWDVDTGETVTEGGGVAKGDEVTQLARVPYSHGAQRFYGIEWKSPAGDGRSHYLAGTPAFDLAKYKAWLLKAGLLAQG
jgi:beta-mannosidase